VIDPLTSRRWLYRSLFVALAGVLIFLRLLPLSTEPVRFPGPDLLLCLAFAWIQRRPDYLPPVLLVAVFLGADLLMMRPPGLRTALVLLGAEFLRSRHQGSAELPFATEWALTAVVVAAVSVVYSLALYVTASDYPGAAMTIVHIVMTIVFYPVVVVASRTLFKLRRPTLGDLDPHGVSR